MKHYGDINATGDISSSGLMREAGQLLSTRYTNSGVVGQHLSSADPHPQYLQENRTPTLITFIDSPYDIPENVHYILADPEDGDIIIRVGAAQTGYWAKIKKIGSSTNSIIISGVNAFIDESNTYFIGAPNEAVELISNGTYWWVF